MKVINETKNVEIPPYEYLLSHIDTFNKLGGYDSDRYRVEGERETLIDVVVYALIYNELGYLQTASICPEDLPESKRLALADLLERRGERLTLNDGIYIIVGDKTTFINPI